MQYLFFIGFLLIMGCDHPNATKANLSSDSTFSASKQIICNDNYDSLLIMQARNFKATNIELNKSIVGSLDSFLLNIDTNCLRKQNEYKLFITTILSKLYYYHLQCCNQGYDLLSMKKGSASIIINEFERFAGYQSKHLEMLNSGIIVDFIKKESQFYNDPQLKELLQKIDKESHRIEKGNI